MSHNRPPQMPESPGTPSRISADNGIPVVSVPAELDFANIDELREALASAGEGQAVVIVDMSSNELCDSSGLVALLIANKQAQTAGGELRLAMDGFASRRTFKVTGASQLFRIFDTVAEAGAARPLRPASET
jgi:anti-sigma B factor antagonist